MLTIKGMHCLSVDECKRPNLFIRPCLKCYYLPWCDEGRTIIKQWAKVQTVTHGNFEREEFLDLFNMKTFKLFRPSKREIERRFDA